MSNELKPCPFCGTINELEECRFLDMIGMIYSIECKKCNDTRVMSLVSMDAAKIKWNTRPAEDALKAENKKLKEKLALVKKHIVDNRDALLFVLKSEQDRTLYCELAFCESLIELINTDPKKESAECPA